MGDRAARAVARRITAVLFDWRGTLAHSPPPRWWGERGLESAGRALDTHELDRVETALLEAGALEGIDASADVHRRETLAAFRRHGLDGGLADALYALDADPANHPLYPDAAPVLRDLKELGAGVAVVSDFHVELRPRIFEIALDALDVDASEAFMVGDRASHDGGAARAGVATLILPPPPADLVPRGLDVVLRIVG